MRGEYQSWGCGAGTMGELPPRARRIPAPPRRSFHKSRNYLRVRGEYLSLIPSPVHAVELPPRARRIQWLAGGVLAAMELPPRARRILGGGLSMSTTLGTTSACAENTSCFLSERGVMGNYLRVRGEYIPLGPNDEQILELPPRARRIRVCHVGEWGFWGTTSACAENTNQTKH